MKKLIPLSLLAASLFLQSCRQGDDLQNENQHTNDKMAVSAKESDTLKSEKKYPPVKDGQDWIY